MENNAARVREQQTRIAQLEKQLRNQAQLEEEVKMYREQAKALTEQLTISAGAAGGQRSPARTPRATTPRATQQPAPGVPSPAPDHHGGSLMSRMSKTAAGLAAKGGSILNDLAAAPPAAAPDR